VLVRGGKGGGGERGGGGGGGEGGGGREGVRVWGGFAGEYHDDLADLSAWKGDTRSVSSNARLCSAGVFVGGGGNCNARLLNAEYPHVPEDADTRAAINTAPVPIQSRVCIETGGGGRAGTTGS